jgi:hypothetical protein
MKWGSRRGSLKIKSWKDIQSIFITILVIIVIIGMLTDYISWKDAMGAIKKNLPSNAYVILQEGGGNTNYRPFNWAGSLKGRVDLFTDEDFNVQTRHIKWTDDKNYVADGMFDGKIKGISGADFTLKQINNDPDFPISYGKTTLKNATGTHTLEMWVYLLTKDTKLILKSL